MFMLQMKDLGFRWIDLQFNESDSQTFINTTLINLTNYDRKQELRQATFELDTHTQQLVQGASPNLFSATTSHASIMLHTYRYHQKPIPLSLKGSHLSLSIQSNPRKVYRINPTKSKHPIRSKAHQGISIPKLFLN